MRPALRLALVVAVLAAAPAGAVSGGRPLPIAQAPYIAWIGGQCTGTLISPTRILTAAHCLDGESAGAVDVLVGIDGNTATFRQRRAARVAVRGYSIHPGYKLSHPFSHHGHRSAIAVDDVGLILLKKPVANVAPVALDGADAAPGTTVDVIGYGDTAPVPAPHPLQVGALTVIGRAACAQAYPGAIRPSMVCTEDLVAHAPLVQACPGDSGGPVIQPTPSGPVQIGITSWGSEVMDGRCGEKPLPDVLMRTSSYLSFIRQRRPVIAPFALGRGLRGAARVTGTPRVGRTVRCVVPKLGGDRARISYGWRLLSGQGIRTIRGANKETLTITRALYRIGTAPRLVACAPVARNAGGSVHLGFAAERLQP